MTAPGTLAHLRLIDAILGALPPADVPHALIACEDAYVALSLGLQLGLSTQQIHLQHRAILREKEETT